MPGDGCRLNPGSGRSADSIQPDRRCHRGTDTTSTLVNPDQCATHDHCHRVCQQEHSGAETAVGIGGDRIAFSALTSHLHGQSEAGAGVAPSAYEAASGGRAAQCYQIQLRAIDQGSEFVPQGSRSAGGVRDNVPMGAPEIQIMAVGSTTVIV
jgi:hypothetical protein